MLGIPNQERGVSLKNMKKLSSELGESRAGGGGGGGGGI